MVTFLHTADWQLGLKLNYIPGDKGALQREVRFQTVDRIAATAREHEVHFVLVAGDVFDDNGVADATIRKAFQHLEAFAPIPVYLLPGNHDALTTDSVYRRDTFQREKPDHVIVLDSREPVEAPGGVVLLPCPLMRRHEVNDPTAHLQPPDVRNKIRICVAHGAMDVLPDAESNNRIDPGRVEQAGLDYLALGDWHGTWQSGSRIWYPGTHEQTRFKESNTGNVLIVHIDAPGAEPRVEQHRVGQTAWLTQEMDLYTAEDIAALQQWYKQISTPTTTLVELTLRGSLGLSDHEQLADLLDRQGDLLRWQRVSDERLLAVASDDDISGIADAGYVRVAIDRLREQARSGEPGIAAEASRALQLLYGLNRKLKEVAK